MIKKRIEYDNYIIFEISRKMIHEYWISNSDESAMIYCFATPDIFSDERLRDLARNGYFGTEEIMIDRI